MSSTLGDPALPPLDGSLTLAEAVDWNVAHNAAHPIFVYSADSTPGEITEISFLEFGRACHRVAHAVRPGRKGSDTEVVAFMALTDTILYQAITVGILRSGLVPFPISPRNTPAAVVHLLKKTDCHRLITTQLTLKTLIDGIRAELAAHDPDYALTIEEIPALADIYPRLGKETAEAPFEAYPGPSTRPSLSDVALYLHSSGSTGFPKAIPQTHLILVHWAAFPSLVQFREHRPSVTIAGMPLPPFHTLGVYAQVIYTLYGAIPIGVYPPVAMTRDSLPVMPTPDNILEHIRRTKSNAMITIPTLLQIWAQSPAAVEILKNMEFVGYSGGSVAPKLGDFLVQSGVRLNPGYGGTEFGSPTVPVPRPGDENEWAYMEFSDRSKVRWVPQGDGTYECQFLVTETHSLPIENLPDVRGYATSDLWERHPTKDYLWRIVGRVDDVIIHASGEKTVPGPMEDIVNSSPYVMGTVMFGREHDQPGILIEPKAEHAIDVADQTQLAGLRNKLWPIIEEANKVAPTFSRVFKEMILITSPDKPLARAGKGTVMRKASLKSYDEEIEALYATVESSAKGESVVPPPSWNLEDVRAWLSEQASEVHSGKAFSASGDLFEQGFDSLSATILRRRLAGALRSTKGDAAAVRAAEFVTQNTVYSYPSIDTLAAHLVGLVSDPQNAVASSGGKAAMEAMIEKYSAGLDTPPAQVREGHQTERTVLITGTTGNLGSQVLAALLGDEHVARVYALNRPSSVSSLGRHEERFRDKALDVGLLKSPKLTFLEGDVAQEGLGLSATAYQELQNTVTAVIHNAWKLDFNLALSSFEPNVRGTRRLIDLARGARHAVRFLFTSSVASAQSWSTSRGPFPEEVSLDASVAVGNGYGEGKYVAERVLAKSGLQATSFRIGQISGGLPNGAWATTDWVPILVKSSVKLGVLPTAAGVVSWLPMHAVANAIIDVAFSSENPPIALNLVHPRPIGWNTAIIAIGDAVLKTRNLNEDALRLVSFQEWFSVIEKRAASASDADLKDVPAIKLLEFFRAISKANEVIFKQGSGMTAESGGLARFATDKAQAFSPTMKALPRLGAADAELWVRYWNAVGLFD